MRCFGALLLVPLALALAGVSPARADWTYVRESDHGKGTLTVTHRQGVAYVSARQFCFALGCRVLYEWAKHRAVIQNPNEPVGAIVSSITHIALVNGEVVDFDGMILSDLREGYLLPLDLAVKLADALALGRVVEHPEEKPEDARLDAMATAFNRIVIDPGHGGHDLGTNFGSIYEKDVAVIYALKLRDELKKVMPDLEVFLTRDSDKYVSLPDRAKFANAHNAGLFVSLHVNHAPNAKVEGLETYILNPEATDDEARKTALLENDTWLKGSKITETSGDAVKKILVEMEQTKYIQGSALAASMIQQEEELDSTRGLRSRGVKQAMFYVLSQVAMPSTLVEMGFLSNTGDRSRLMDIGFQSDFIRQLAAAIKHYRDRVNHPQEKILEKAKE